MPHTLILAVGSSGDVHPMLALAKSLRARGGGGHEVTVVANPHFESLVRQLRFRFLPIGTEEQYHLAMANPDLWHSTRALPLILREFISAAIEPLYRMVEFIKPDLVIGTPLSLGARVAHDKLGIPYATVLLAPAALVSVEYPPFLPTLSRHSPQWLLRFQFWLLNRFIDRIIAPSTNGFRATLGLPKARNIINNYWLSPQLVLCLFPEIFLGHPIPTDWPPNTRLTGFPLYDEADVLPLDPAVEAFLAAGPPPVVFTPGSAMTQAHDFFSASAAAIQNLNVRALFLTRFPEQIPKNLPPTIAHFPFIPLSRILPRCAALVCHGGIGTVSQGLAAGIPQLIMPMAHDQPDNATRVKLLGCGLSLPRKKYKTPAVTAALSQLLTNPNFKTHAQSTAQSIAQTSATAMGDSCNLLEQLLTPPRHRG